MLYLQGRWSELQLDRHRQRQRGASQENRGACTEYTQHDSHSGRPEKKSNREYS